MGFVMFSEKLSSERGTCLRKNGSQPLQVEIPKSTLKSMYLINGTKFLTSNVSDKDLSVASNDFYMVINMSNDEIEIRYDKDIKSHKIIYDPYKYERAEKVDFKESDFLDKFKVSKGYIDTLPKWYSFKFTFPNFNLIFIRPELGISFQIHHLRSESWEVLEGNPIIINGNKVHYFVEDHAKFEIPTNAFHSIINPNKDKFVLVKERWSGQFDEGDIVRSFNPNHYK